MNESEQFIQLSLIKKLDHKIAEIRERALLSISSKLENGFIFENDLAGTRELLSYLFNWFLFEPCNKEDVVLKLIKTILQLPIGHTLIRHIGKSVIETEIVKIKSFIDPKFHSEIGEILNLLESELCTGDSRVPSIVPPFINNVPLSYRSNCDDDYMVPKLSPLLGKTASTMQGLVEKSSSYEPQIGVTHFPSDRTMSSNRPTYRLEDSETIVNPSVNPSSNPKSEFILKWQPLIETDRNVLQSVENSLKNPNNSSSLFHSCEFFINVLLHDFPAEVFIQRPGIITAFYDLLSRCHSTRLTNIILQCLLDLTKALQIRINHYLDPCMQNFKIEVLPNLVYFCATPSSNRNSQNGGFLNNDQFEIAEETKVLKNLQFTLPDYCFRTMNIVLKCMSFKIESVKEHKPKLNQVGQTLSLALLNEAISLLHLTLGDQFWESEKNGPQLIVLKDTNNSLALLGDTLEYFRLESLSLEENLICRVVYLYLLCISIKWLRSLIPVSKTQLILPKNFKLSLTNSLLDISLGRLYPKVHKSMLQFVESFSSESDKTAIRKYETTMRICDGLSTTVKFLRDSGKLTAAEKIKLAHSAIPSVEFHKNLQFLSAYVDLCSDKLYSYRDDLEVTRLAKETTIQLLAHRLPDIQEEMFILCHKKVIDNISTPTNFSSTGIVGSQIYFLLDSDICKEIAMFAVKNERVRAFAEEILLYILKCKVIVTEQIWDSCIESLIPALPVIVCHADNTTALGRTIVNIIDPDTAKVLLIPEITMLKCNVELLFAVDPILREEAFSRLCWLIAKQEDSRNILPKFNTIYDKALANVCVLKQVVVDVNKLRKSDHFYQPSSLHQVLDLLRSDSVEPVIRRSALNQVSVMLEDYLLHDVFLDASGIDLMIELMARALKENDYRDYPDSIIPIVSILKSLSLYHSSVREELSINPDVMYYILRGLFLFFTEDRMRHDGAVLLFIIIFKDYLRGSPAKATFSIPNVVHSSFQCPFIAHLHLSSSENSKENLYAGIIQDRWSLSSLQVQWNADLYDGFNNLIQLNEASFPLPPTVAIASDEILTLKAHDLQQIKYSSVHYCFQKYLYMIQNATSHDVVQDCLAKLALYLQFYQVACQLSDVQYSELLSHPWEKSLARYLEVLPSSDEDIHLLFAVIKLLIILLPFYKDSEHCWISIFLKNPRHCLLDLLAAENNIEEDTKLLSQELVKLITLCVSREHHYLDYYITNERSPLSGWRNVVKIISDNIRFNNTQHFYNLAYLDALLSCLVHLTARLGWSQCRAGSPPLEPIPQLISSLCELLTAFHCGKGATATVSVMGLSISRNVLFIINHLLAELQFCKVRKWERCFFDEESRSTRSFLALWASRDVILRAAALQLFNNLTTSSRASDEIVHDLNQENGNIWELALTVVTDHSEAAIVRENAAFMLANLCSHLFYTSPTSSTSVSLSVSSSGVKKRDVLTLFGEFDFFNHLDIILTSLFTLDYSVKTSGLPIVLDQESEGSSSSGSEPRDIPVNVSTPGLIKSVCTLLYNLIDLDPMGVCGRLHDGGLIKLIFRTICLPSIAVDNKRELALYCTMLEMNTSVCCVLRKLCRVSALCVGTVLHTKDCMNVLFGLLNTKNYHTHLSELVYLKNKLWSEIFNLIATLLDDFEEDKSGLKKTESLLIVSETIEQTGVDIFLDALCESLGSIGTNDLQNSSLIVLVALLRSECDITLNQTDSKLDNHYSIENILDTVKSPKTVFMSALRHNEPRKKVQYFETKQNDSSSHKSVPNLLEEAYFGKVINQIPKSESMDEIEVSIIESSDDALMVGAELCKILLYLFDVINIKLLGDGQITKKKSMVIAGLSGLLCISQEAKKLALEKGLLETVVKELRDFHIKLSLESVESLRRVQDKKRIVPVIQEIVDLIGLLTNFMLNCQPAKRLAVSLDVADVVHKLWIWFLFQKSNIVDVLKLLSVFTLECPEACRTLPLTSSVAGSGPRKTPSNVSLLHSIIALITKEMEQISRSHDLQVLESAFDVLHHCCDILECRVVISKSNLFQSMTRLHPGLTKRQFPWDNVELIWLEFLQTYTQYPEGQSTVARGNDLLDILIGLTNNTKEVSRHSALLVLRNVTFYQPNRPRLLSSGDFLNVLQSKMTSGSCEEKKTVVAIIWSMAANNQKAKLIFKSAKLDFKLENIIKCSKLLGPSGGLYEKEDLEMMELVLSILRGSDKSRCSK